MNRRTFTKLTASAFALPPIAPAAVPTTTGKMKLGTQNQSTDEMLRILAALGVNISAEELFATLSDAWAELRGVWDDGRGFGEIRRLWLERAAGLGQKVTVQNGGSTVEGTFDTLDESGCMVIRTTDGGRVPISAGDVYFGAAASAGAV